jgi:hypothetical protein
LIRAVTDEAGSFVDGRLAALSYVVGNYVAASFVAKVRFWRHKSLLASCAALGGWIALACLDLRSRESS